MFFLLDAQLPPAIAGVFVSAGQKASHVASLGLLTATDRQIWNKAKSLNAVLVSKDGDFVTLRQQADKGPAVVWIRVGNTSTKALRLILERALPQIKSAIDEGEIIIEIR